MNILVAPYDRSSFYFRSDSTLIRAIEKLYVPECVTAMSMVPVVYFKCSRPGKSVAVKFASRFIDAFGYGLLLHPDFDGSVAGNRDFVSNALDYTTHIPLDIFKMSEYGKSLEGIHPFSIKINGQEAYTDLKNPTHDEIYKTISQITSLCSTRVGDFIAFELAGKIQLEKGMHITADVAGKQIISFLLQ